MKQHGFPSRATKFHNLNHRKKKQRQETFRNPSLKSLESYELGGCLTKRTLDCLPEVDESETKVIRQGSGDKAWDESVVLERTQASGGRDSISNQQNMRFDFCMHA